MPMYLNIWSWKFRLCASETIDGWSQFRATIYEETKMNRKNEFEISQATI